MFRGREVYSVGGVKKRPKSSGRLILDSKFKIVSIPIKIVLHA
jgi:hypothetical protein